MSKTYTIGIKPDKDNFHSYPLQLEFEISSSYVTMKLRGNGEEGTREVSFTKDQMCLIVDMMNSIAKHE